MPAVSVEVPESPPVGRRVHWLTDAANWNLHKHEERDTWFWGRSRAAVTHFLNSRPVHIILLILIIFDVAIVVAELALDASKVCVVEHADGEHGNGHGGETIPHEAPIEEPPTVTPVEPPIFDKSTAEECHLPCNVTLARHFAHHEAEEAYHVLHWLSVAILALFILENLILIVCLGYHVFKARTAWFLLLAIDALIRKWFVIVDLIILTVSLALDLALDATVASLAVVLRIWRMVRIVHGVLESALEKQEDDMKKLRHKNKELTHKVEELNAQLEEALARKKKKNKDN